jgi:2,3-dihydroxy-p-cumate/2,3-dihydroxybenzoate 3,4-dioxygenase
MTRPPSLSLAYACLATDDLVSARAFALDIVGLEEVDLSEDVLAFRSDERFFSLAFQRLEKTSSFGLHIDDEEIDATAKRLNANGFRCHFADGAFAESRAVHRALIASDASGNRIELVTRPRVSARRFFPARDGGVVNFQGVGLRSVDVERDLLFWSMLPGTHVSDRVGDIAYVSIDEKHHRVALYPSQRKGLLNVAFEVNSLDDVMQNYHFVSSRQVRIAQGPGREQASGQVFLHFFSPCETLFSYVAEMRTIDRTRDRPRQFARSAEALCAWGSECVFEPDLAPIPGQTHALQQEAAI